jgi:uncharacterized membrane protein YqjE
VPSVNPGRRGPFRSLGRIWSWTVEGALDRVDLFTLELKEERIRFVGVLLAGVLVSLFGFMTFLLLNATILALAWEHRVVVLLSMLGAYSLLTLGLALALWYRVRHGAPPFASTLEELRKDRKAFFGDG